MNLSPHIEELFDVSWNTYHHPDFFFSTLLSSLLDNEYILYYVVPKRETNIKSFFGIQITLV